jgi:homocysteine S-methyltransferase
MKDSDTKVPDFAALLASGRPLLIDGGLATQCEAMGHNIDGDLWSAVLLQKNPRAIIDASRAYLDAGAEIIATASYQASRQGLIATGLSAAEAGELIVSSVLLAQQARDEFLRDNPDTHWAPLIAASIGPYGAVLHDGSEYTGTYDITEEDLFEFHRSRLELLDGAGADLLACETIPSFVEAKVLCELLRSAHCPAWISFSCRNEQHLCDGALLAEAAALFRGHPTVLAVGVNCVQPQLLLPLIQVIKDAVPDKAIVVYPNSGEVYDAEDNSWSGTVTDLQCERSAQEWIDAGARLVGGCCRIGPEQIAAMAGCSALEM